MADLFFTKSSHGLLPADAESRAWYEKLRAGVTVAATMRVPRNIRFHRKYFAMLNVAYENWDKPEIETPYGKATCTISKFRRDVTILAGYGEPVCNVKGEWRMEAKSIAFGRMDEAEFDRLYQDTLNIVLERFLPEWSEETMQNAINQMLEFA